MQEHFRRRNVAIFLYENVEILDFGGPAEVFAITGKTGPDGQWTPAFSVYTVAADREEIRSQGFLRVVPDYSIEDCPNPDIVVFPGGSTQKSRRNPRVIRWIQDLSFRTEIMMSVCTGAFLLGDAGLLEGITATTWHGRIQQLKDAYPTTKVLENVRFVDNGKIITTAGVSAGIDGALHIVERLVGKDMARAAAEYMEYDKRESGHEL